MVGPEVEKDFPQSVHFLSALSGVDGPLVALGDGIAARSLSERREERGTASHFLQTLPGKKAERV